MLTKKLYQDDVYMKECLSKVLSISGSGSKEDPLLVVLDQTIFFPEGGGQPCDLGEIQGFEVVDVFEKDGIIYHQLNSKIQADSKIMSENALNFKEQDTVASVLDWTARFNNMQRHCGEHILSGIFFQECGGVNKGFHMGNSYMTIDIDVAEISQDTLERVELLANKVIWENLPVTTRYFESKEAAEGLPLRKPLAIDEDITIVCVGSEENPADCVACCGTHPSTAGQVGLIKIIKSERYKGMTRVYVKAGSEALADYTKKHEILTKLNNKYSSDDDSLLEKINIQEEKNKNVRTELHKLKASLLSIYNTDITNAYSTGDYFKEGNAEILIKEYSELAIDDLISLGRQVTPFIKGLLLLVSPAEHTVLLFSNGNPDCGKLVKDNAPIYGGKGGGNATNARALFSKQEYAETFIDLLQKHLR